MQDECETAKHQHDAGSDQRHDGEMSCHRIGNGKRDEHRGHKDCSRNKNAKLRVRCKKQNQWPDVEGKLEDRIELLLFDHVLYESRPTTARAKSRAVNGARSPTPSPTPMKCTGKPNLSARATRIPPRAVPSSLVMTRPVTPAVLPKISTWLSAFCPTVGSRTRSTA